MCWKVREPGDILEKLDLRIEHILVDEFQDTSVMQCALLRGLTSGWQEQDGRRTLFLVGDPMQSIYRFRKAEVGLFVAARTRPRFFENCELTSLGLTVNFRSTRALIDWVNDGFSRLLGDRDDPVRSIVAFAPAKPPPKAPQGQSAEFILWSCDTAATQAEHAAAEAAGLADWIAEDLRARRARGEQASSQAPVAVLVRGRSKALPLLRALESRAPELRVRAPGLDRLADRAVVADLEALTRAILHAGDRLSWLALLRAPWIGLPLDEIARLVEPDVARAGRRARPIPDLLRDQDARARVGEDSRRRIDRLLEVLDAARSDRAVRSLDVVVRSAWLRLGGPAVEGAAAPVDGLDAEAFFDLLARRERSGTVDLDDLANALRATEAAVDTEAVADVEVMTMHKAKGLEFDTVVLPGLGLAGGGDDSLPLAMETEPDSGLLSMLAPREARGRDDSDGDKFDYLNFREERRGESEELRILYVAATRAKERLLFSAAEGHLTKKERRAHAGSLLASLAPVLPPSAATVRKVEPGAAAAAPVRTRFPASLTLRGLPTSIADLAVDTEAPSALAEVTPQFFAASRVSAHIGTVFHAWMQRIAVEGLSSWSPARLQAESAAIRRALRSAGVLASELDAACARVASAVAATLEDPKGRWILDAHAGARSEWAILGYRQRLLTSAVIDRCFDADGARWIVDFKTGRLDGGETTELAATGREEIVARTREQYARQLALYRSLLIDRGSEMPVRVALFFPEWPAERRWQDITDEVEALEKAQAAGNPAA